MRLLLLVILLAGCGASPLSLLTGGGPNVAANVQAGKENTQQAVGQQTRTDAGRDVIQQSSPVIADQIKEVNIQQTPIWMIVLLVLGWLLPSPNEIARWIRGLFRKWKT
jgi:hypothetical protein